jgi:hypothetical protein
MNVDAERLLRFIERELERGVPSEDITLQIFAEGKRGEPVWSRASLCVALVALMATVDHIKRKPAPDPDPASWRAGGVL